ncbi:hypothetical protein WJX73_005075 [Symbiochloris irregularis]|uniref:Protein MAK16 homolog n=1 Tax=Symbiochloris irregularis TaxID=706552 RepID=A0AAW1P6P5_9CHLO
MQHDEIIWQVINHGHCSYKVKTQAQNFCRNEYNVTGLCNRSSCPLANSKYATIKEDNGKLYLCIKSVERAHSPKSLWQKIRLKGQYAQALAQIDEHLQYWPKFLVHKNKQRLTKITQYMIRMRRMATSAQPKLVPLASRTEKRERRREAKAETAAKLEVAIETELLKRLKAGTYGDIYNFPTAQYEKALEQASAQEEEPQQAMQYVEGSEEENSDAEADESEEEDVQYVEEDELELDDEDLEDYAEYAEGDDSQGDGSSESEDEQAAAKARKSAPAQKGLGRAAKRRREQVEIEYEREQELPAGLAKASW